MLATTTKFCVIFILMDEYTEILEKISAVKGINRNTFLDSVSILGKF